MKSAKCEVSFQGYDYRNVLTVISPTGKSVKLDCSGKWDCMGTELSGLVNELMGADHKDIPWGSFVERNVSFATMGEILELANS